MGILAIAKFALEAIKYMKAAVEAGRDIKEFYDTTSAALQKMRDENRGPTDAEWEALNAESKKLSDEIANAKP